MSQAAAKKQQAVVEVYYSPLCGYCRLAIGLLARREVRWQGYDILKKPALFEEMRRRSGGRRTVPQIFINRQSVGGFEELNALEQSGVCRTL